MTKTKASISCFEFFIHCIQLDFCGISQRKLDDSVRRGTKIEAEKPQDFINDALDRRQSTVNNSSPTKLCLSRGFQFVKTFHLLLEKRFKHKIYECRWSWFLETLSSASAVKQHHQTFRPDVQAFSWWNLCGVLMKRMFNLFILGSRVTHQLIMPFTSQ